jgi:peptidoglycan/xylan/chitin deacetylase (PgdA/CDA1 family)
MPRQARSLRAAGFTPVLGDVYPGDAHDPGVDHIVACVTKRIAPGSILILHDASFVPLVSRLQTFHALERILPALAARGLSATTVAELRATAPETRSA